MAIRADAAIVVAVVIVADVHDLVQAVPSRVEEDVITDIVNKRNITDTAKAKAHVQAPVLAPVLALVLVRHAQVLALAIVQKVSVVIHSIHQVHHLVRNPKIVAVVTKNAVNPRKTKNAEDPKNRKSLEDQRSHAVLALAAAVPAVQVLRSIVELANAVPPVHQKSSSEKSIYHNESVS